MMEAIREFWNMEVAVWQMMLVVGVLFIWGCASFWQTRRKEMKKRKREKEWEQLKKNYPNLW